MTHDLVIRNGTVIDGSGRPRYRADIGASDGRITTIGRIRERGRHDIDAEGQVVSPGFIDGHTHFDAQINWDPLGTCASWHGVTTAVMGNCGFTIAPCRAEAKDLALRSLERAEDMSRAAMLAGIDWDWETFPEYLDHLDRLPLGINVAGYIGHSALRTHVMGERAFEQTAGDDDLAAMARAVEEAIRAGAIGFSTSRSPSHATSDDRPVASRLADWNEVQALVGVLGDLGAGVFELAMEQHGDPDDQRAYFDRLRDLTVASGRPTMFVCAMSSAAPDRHRLMLDLLDETAAAGGRMVGQVHGREFLSVLGFATHLPFDGLPGWQALRARPLAEQRSALTDPARRHELVDEALHGRYSDGIGAEMRRPDYDIIRLLDSSLPPYRTVADVAAERGVTPVDAMIDVALEGDLDVFFAQPFANQDLDAVLELIRHPRTLLAISDSGAHVSQIIDSSIPTFLLAHWVRSEEALTWEEGVRMLTSDPAAAWGFHDRGLVQQGCVADLVVFDPETVGPALPTADNDLPAGAPRLKQKAIGISATVVAGEPLLVDGEHTGALPGQVLRGPLAG